MVHVFQNFRQKEFLEEESNIRVNTRDAKFGIVDGYHRYQAVTRLNQNQKFLENFMSYVTVINNCFPVEQYCLLVHA